MHSSQNLSRRQFLASTSALVLAGNLPGAEPAPAAGDATLAVNGGARAVPGPAPKLVRWGEPERKRLNELIQQDTLFYWNGPQTKALTDRFQKLCPLKYVMPCSSGSAALHLAVIAAGIGPGDEVITSPITDIGTVIGVLYQQAVPVFADVIGNTYNLDPADVERRITPRTKAIIVVHLAGNPCDMEAFKAMADKHGLVLIEDSAQAWGGQWRGQPIGTLGHITCFSLQNSKQITCGDGGVAASSDERFGPKLQLCGDKGFDRSNPGARFQMLAPNYRMSEAQAAIVAAQLDRLQDLAGQRSKLGRLLSELTAGLPGVEPHHLDPRDRCTHYLYMLRIKPEELRCDRAGFAGALRAEGVPASAGYIPSPLYGEPVFQKHAFFAGRWPAREMGLTTMDYTKVSCPEAEAVVKTCVRVALTEAMDESYIRSVAQGIRKVASHFAV